MNENNAGENLVKTWAEAQQKLLSDWLNTVQKFSGTPTQDLWMKTVDAWQTSVKETLDAQSKWSREWTELLANAKGTPEELRELVQQGRAQMQHWIDTERQIWQNWFNIVKDINFRVESGNTAQAGKDLLQLWQESAHRMIDAQTALVRRWTSSISGTNKES